MTILPLSYSEDRAAGTRLSDRVRILTTDVSNTQSDIFISALVNKSVDAQLVISTELLRAGVAGRWHAKCFTLP